LYIRALAKDGITPDVFLIQSWYGVPRLHVPETKVGTTTHTAALIASEIDRRFGEQRTNIPEWTLGWHVLKGAPQE
jgi:hypothetical protein